MMLSSSSSTIPATFLCLLAASGGLIRFVAAKNNVTVEQLYGKLTSTTAAPPGFNVEGGSVFTNFADMVNNGQFFFLGKKEERLIYERPDSEPVQLTVFDWCSDLTFSDVNNSSLMGYAGRCVGKILTGYDAMEAAGAQLAFDYSEGSYSRTLGISAVFVEQLNVFEGQFHANIDDWVYRYWDDGRKTMPIIAWEGHDEGDMKANAATASRSGFGERLG